MVVGNEINKLLLNHITDFIISDDDGSTPETYYPIENVRVDENVPTDRIPLRLQRTYAQQDPDIELSATLTGTSDIVDEVYAKLGTTRGSNHLFVERRYQFAAKDTQSTAAGTVSLTVNGVLLGRTFEQSGPTGSPRLTFRIRVISASVTVAGTDGS